LIGLDTEATLAHGRGGGIEWRSSPNEAE